mmetsp:Transcript_6104/g.10071  ORF Transcript_6104/g.10071 Transcript_6104/m.10071 type:complete len:106 (-) Transcript_6104:60-377(-)
MVCGKCQKKLSKNITPDTHKWTGQANVNKSKQTKTSKLAHNSLMEKRKQKKKKFKKGGDGKCRICKGVVHQKLYYYCQPCAYQKGICAMCGKKLLDTSKYCQSNV